MTTDRAQGPRIVFVGAGAIGSYSGAHLARAGHDVTLVDPFHAHIEAIRAHGLEVAEMEGSFTVPVPTLQIGDVQQLAKERPVDIAVVTMKSYDTDWATALIRPYLARDGYVVSMQNGLNEERIAALVGRERVVGCVATYSAELTGPGRMSRGNPRGRIANTYAVGELDGTVTPRLEALATLLGDIDNTIVTTNLLGERWTKLILNAMRNGVSALTGLSINGCDSDPNVRKLAYGVVHEAVTLAHRLGMTLKAATGMDLETIARAGGGDPAAFAEAEATLTANLASRSTGARPSMGQDILKGRQTEIAFLNGLIADKAQELGVPAPLNRALTDRVLQIYHGEISASPAQTNCLLNLAPAALQAL
jgi:2-dehydropantoate 2-reductase